MNFSDIEEGYVLKITGEFPWYFKLWDNFKLACGSYGYNLTNRWVDIINVGDKLVVHEVSPTNIYVSFDDSKTKYGMNKTMLDLFIKYDIIELYDRIDDK